MFSVLALASLPFFTSLIGAAPDSAITTLPYPTDALSVTFESADSTAEVSFKNTEGKWSAWQALEVDNEQDPLLRESNLVIFPEAVDHIKIRNQDVVSDINPIAISHEPSTYQVAAISATSRPRILTRSQWGADDSLLYTTKPERQYTDTSSNDSATEERLDDCAIAQRDYPEEFRTSNRQTIDESGNRLRWVREYSPSIKLIALHHTAIGVSGDERSGIERMRALYTYHANNRGWGDVGYHYLIDEEGQIYEGKSGGPLVVGGHAYCNNVGTIGIALMGNFENEQPTQDQLKSSQWLIKHLADRYGIDLNKKITFHGKTMEPVVGHRDLVSTACPGFYVYGSIAQLLDNASTDNVYADVRLPTRPQSIRRIATTPTKTLEERVAERAAARGASRAKDAQPRSVQRILNSQASRLLMRKLRAGAAANAASSTATSRTQRVAITRTASSSSASNTVTRVASSISNPTIRIRLTRQENGAPSCEYYDLSAIQSKYRGTVRCTEIDGVAVLINTVSMEDYMMGLVEEPDTEPYEKQRAFAIAARSYATHYLEPQNRKFPGMPYDGSDSPATFQLYGGREYEAPNPRWVQAVQTTSGQVLMKDDQVVKAPYFSSNDGRTRSPSEIGWNNFPFAEVFASKEDPWCAGMDMRGHGVGMSGCGAEGQANEGKSAEDILSYYYPGTTISVSN